jgi:hypothetical protein
VPSHKALKGVVHDVVQSFASLMNYSSDAGGDYIMGHIVYAAWSTGATDLRVNLLNGQASFSPLLVPPVKKSVENLASYFPRLLEASGSAIDFVASAELSVIVDPTRRRSFRNTRFFESPFTCSARIVDDRGKPYEYTVRDWWYPERLPPTRRWPWPFRRGR